MDRFWSKVRKTPGINSCWEWTAALDENGYGKFKLDGEVNRAHRVLWLLRRGAVPRGKFVLHHCDNPRCVRLKHLYIGTKKDNAQDRERRGRGNHAVGLRNGRHTHPGQTRGSNNGRAKLTETKVRKLLLAFKHGRCKADLARDYGLSKTSIGHIVSGKLWPHVEGRV